MATQDDKAKDSMESLSWPNTSRPIISHSDSDPSADAIPVRALPPRAGPPRRRWPVLVAVVFLLLVLAVIAWLWLG